MHRNKKSGSAATLPVSVNSQFAKKGLLYSNMTFSINECTREEITEKLKIAGFLIECIGSRLVNTGTPADKEIVSLACDEISQMIDSAIYQLSEVTA